MQGFGHKQRGSQRELGPQDLPQCRAHHPHSASAPVLSQGPPRAAPQPPVGGCQHPNTLPPCPQGTLPPSMMSGSLMETKGDAERVILQKSKNKNAGMMTSGRARAGEGGV